jgi:hypothetical protein
MPACSIAGGWRHPASWVPDNAWLVGCNCFHGQLVVVPYIVLIPLYGQLLPRTVGSSTLYSINSLTWTVASTDKWDALAPTLEQYVKGTQASEVAC